MRLLRWRDLTAELGPLRLRHPVARRFRLRTSLEKELRHDMGRSAPDPPRIDFERRDAVLVSPGPRSSTGYGVRIVRIVEQRRRVLVVLRELTPRLRDRVQPRVTYPYRLLTIPRTGKHVTFDWLGRP